jgi:hypothetical protein
MPGSLCLLLNDFRLHQDIGISGISAAAVARIAETKEQAKPGHQQDQEYDDAGSRFGAHHTPSRQSCFSSPARVTSPGNI